VSVTVTQGVTVVGVAGWPVILTGWLAGDGGRGQPAAADAEWYRCTCGLEWGHFGVNSGQ